jgi:hypothetical protein
VQKKGETLRSYISRWLGLRNTTQNISNERAIDAFRDSLIRRDFRETLGRTKPQTIDALMSLANEWADGEDLYRTPETVVAHQTKATTRKTSPTWEHVGSVREVETNAILTSITLIW